MVNLSSLLNALIAVLSPRTKLGIIQVRRPKRAGWYWPIVISLVYFTLLISLTNND